MTLLRQLILVIVILFVLLFAGTFAISVHNTQTYLSEQLKTISQDTATSLGLTLSLYDGGLTGERVREAQLKLEQLRVLDAHMRQQIELEVRQAWLALERSDGELRAAGTAVAQGREAARLAAVRYQAGVGTQLELLSAQSALAQAERGLAAARFGHGLARIRLMLAAGSL